MLKEEWNIDELEVGKLYRVECHFLRAHKWDEKQQKLLWQNCTLDKGSILMLIETDLPYEWDQKINPDNRYTTYGSPASNHKKGIFHSFIYNDKLILLERADLYELEPVTEILS